MSCLFPDGPYGVFAGKDASRGLATFSLSADAIKDEYDDLTDLNSMQMESVREWELQFTGVLKVSLLDQILIILIVDNKGENNISRILMTEIQNCCNGEKYFDLI